MNSDCQSIGDLGENIACGYLSDKGYKIIDRNFSTSFGEIDIIAKSPDKIIVFVEVKALYKPEVSGNTIRQSYPQPLPDIQCQENSLNSPEIHLNKNKIERLKKLSQWYSNRFLADSLFRIDGICIDIFSSHNYRVRHYENIGYN